jgi:hypothetical protein
MRQQKVSRQTVSLAGRLSWPWMLLQAAAVSPRQSCAATIMWVGCSQVR